MASKHTIETGVPVRFWPVGCDDYETAYPTLEIKYSFTPGDPGCWYQRNGDQGWPPEAAEVELISAKLIDGDGLIPTQDQVDDWATDWLDSEIGFNRACEYAEDDLLPDTNDAYDRKRDDRLTERD